MVPEILESVEIKRLPVGRGRGRDLILGHQSEFGDSVAAHIDMAERKDLESRKLIDLFGALTKGIELQKFRIRERKPSM